jgi:hypothetical protein
MEPAHQRQQAAALAHRGVEVVAIARHADLQDCQGGA